MKTTVTQLLELEGVNYRLLPHSKPAKTIAEAATERGVAAEQMVKSILLRDMSGFHVLACVPPLLGRSQKSSSTPWLS